MHHGKVHDGNGQGHRHFHGGVENGRQKGVFKGSRGGPQAGGWVLEKVRVRKPKVVHPEG